MEWTDTLMLEPRRPTPDNISRTVAYKVRVIPVEGVSLLHAEVRTHEETEATLELLRGFRAARRVVLCDTSFLVDDTHTVERQLGHTLVNSGDAEMLVSCGSCAREVAIGARDAGLDLASVVVCGDAKSACEVLTHRLIPGDTVLLLGLDRWTCDRLTASLAKRLFPSAVAA